MTRMFRSAAFALAIAGAIGLGTAAAPAVAADTMMSAADCSPEAMHAMMGSTREKLSMMKSSGNVDKDYAATMAMMTKAAMSMNAFEMKCGKNAKAKKMASDSQKNLDSLYHQFDSAFSTSSP